MSSGLDALSNTQARMPDALSGAVQTPYSATEATPKRSSSKRLSETFNDNGQRTRLHEILNDKWGVTWPDPEAYGNMIKYAMPQKTKEIKDGFEIPLMNGKKISWEPQSQSARETIHGPHKGFDQDAADAMIALAKMRGWRSVDITGTPEQKEMLWLAVQKQNDLDRKAFERGQENGTIPKTDNNGKPVQFIPMGITHTPLADSPIHQQAPKPPEPPKNEPEAAKPNAPAQTSAPKPPQQRMAPRPPGM